MKRIAKFHKVSFEQFAKDWKDTFEQYSEEEIRNIYDSLKLPKRATTGSAGYDFYAPDDFVIEPGKTIKIPTGIRVEMEENLSSGYDLVFYSEFENQEALKDFQNHPLHEAHKKRCKDLVCKRLCGNIERK